jgi:hypothetical protein
MGCCACDPITYDVFSTIVGTVVDDETMEPIEDVEVRLSPYRGDSKKTKSDGSFEFTNLEAMQYTIVVHKLGYSSNKKSINAIAGDTVETIITMSRPR